MSDLRGGEGVEFAAAGGVDGSWGEREKGWRWGDVGGRGRIGAGRVRGEGFVG